MQPRASIHSKRSRRRHPSRLRGGVLAAILLTFGVSAPTAAAELVSRRLPGLPVSATPTGYSSPGGRPISADGRFVVFLSSAADVVVSPPDGNQTWDVFVRDLLTGTTTLVSVNAAGTSSGNGFSRPVAISADGRRVIFESSASDLVAGDDNGQRDVFLRDLQSGTTELVSVDATGATPGNADSTAVAMTPDGRFVAFDSHASDLVDSDANGQLLDAFVRDLQSDVTVLVSTDTGDAVEAWSHRTNAISSDGRYVTFGRFLEFGPPYLDGSAGTIPWPAVYRRDLQTNTTQLVTVNHAGTGNCEGYSYAEWMSPNGRFVVFGSAASDLAPGGVDHNGRMDAYVRDMQSGVTTLVSVNSAGTEAGSGESYPAAISDDGRYVVFSSSANDLVPGDDGEHDVFVRDLQANHTELVSVDSGGAKGKADSWTWSGQVSTDGRFVLFGSYASNLVAGDTNGAADVFLRDRQLGTTTLVSAAFDGRSANAASDGVGLTSDGAYVVLSSYASDITPGDLNDDGDVFVRDLDGATTALVSTRAALPTPATGNHASWLDAISEDGRHVLFTSEASDLVPSDGYRRAGVFVRDLDTGTNQLVSINAAGTDGANGYSFGVGLSLGGRYVLFSSWADDLVAAANHGWLNAYVRDLQAGTTELVSVNAGGDASGNSLSTARAITPSGRFVLFESWASDLVAGDANDNVDVFLRDLQAGVTELVSVDYSGSSSAAGGSSAVAVTSNGRYVLFESDAGDLVGTPPGGYLQVYVRDRKTGTTELVSVPPGGIGGVGGAAFARAISADGRYVLFDSPAVFPGDGIEGWIEGWNVFVRDRQAGTTTLVSRNVGGTGPGNDGSFSNGFSADGRYVLFGSFASDLVPNDVNGTRDVFRRDLETNTTTLVSVNAAGTGGGNGPSDGVELSSDGGLVTFQSEATDLVGGDGQGGRLLFMRDLETATTSLVSAAPGGTWCCLAASGVRVAFESLSPDLVANDFNGASDVFVADTGRALPTLPFADGFELGTLSAWSAFAP